MSRIAEGLNYAKKETSEWQKELFSGGEVDRDQLLFELLLEVREIAAELVELKEERSQDNSAP